MIAGTSLSLAGKSRRGASSLSNCNQSFWLFRLVRDWLIWWHFRLIGRFLLRCFRFFFWHLILGHCCKVADFKYISPHKSNNRVWLTITRVTEFVEDHVFHARKQESYASHQEEAKQTNKETKKHKPMNCFACSALIWALTHTHTLDKWIKVSMWFSVNGVSHVRPRQNARSATGAFWKQA